MDMRLAAQARLARWAARRPHVLLVTAPGGTRQRLAVEAHLPVSGGVLARSPADADLLVVAGTPSTELGAAIERVWEQIPAPRARLAVLDPAAAPAVLEAGVRQLTQGPTLGARCGRQSGARHAPGNATEDGEHPDHRPGHSHTAPDQHGHDGDHDADAAGHDDHARHGDHTAPAGREDVAGAGGHAGGGADHVGHVAEDGNHGGHGGGHGEHAGHAGHGGMQMPGGLMMADRAPDRDGLKLDVLHVPLGPVLPAWPAGLLVDTEMQGDVLQSASARVLTAADGLGPGLWADPEPPRRAAAHLDSLTRLLEVAGWSAAAAEARRLRDQLLASGFDPGGAAARGRAFARFAGRVRRSWGLRRCLAGVGQLDAREVARLGLSGPAARATAGGGDAWARTLTWLSETAAALDGEVIAPAETSRGTPAEGSAALLRAATRLMPGLHVADARLAVASLDPDTDELGPT